MYRSKSLENKELMALCSRGQYLYGVQDIDCNSEDEESDSEFYKDAGGGGEMRNSLSMDNCALRGEEEEEEECQVYFSNQEYYWRLEELKKTHLRNMAELEKMYIGRSEGGHQHYQHGLGLGLGSGGNSLAEEQAAPTRRLQRINSQEELDFHDTSSGSDQSELSSGQDSVGELELYMECLAGIPSQDKTFGRDSLVNPEISPARIQFFLPAKGNDAGRLKPKPAISQSAMSQSGMSQSEMVAWVKPTSKATVPKPFQMMLREEERKRRQVRTRSEVELENTLLRRELEELRECRKKFRATPAPAHTHRPLYEVIGRRATQRSRAETSCNRATPTTGPLQPFSFLERERRKKEARIVAELGNLCPKEVSCTFKARPLPCSVYSGPRQRGGHSPEAKTMSPPKSPSATSIAQADKEIAEEIVQQEAERGRLPERSWISGRCSMNKSVKKHMEVSIEMVKEREWSYVHPHLTASCDVHSMLGPDEEMHILADNSV